MRKAAKAKANGNGKKKKTTDRSEVFQEAYGGGPGKGTKKKNGKIKVKLAMDSSRPNNLTNASYTKSQLNKGIQSGKITLRPGSKNIYIVKK